MSFYVCESLQHVQLADTERKRGLYLTGPEYPGPIGWSEKTATRVEAVTCLVAAHVMVDGRPCIAESLKLTVSLCFSANIVILLVVGM